MPLKDELRDSIDVYEAEWRTIQKRRLDAAATGLSAAAATRLPAATPRDLTGLALSGGGIRSATFNLGVLQALNRGRLLGYFDYLSTVSGGGYLGGWWSAWLARSKARGTFPDDEGVETWRHQVCADHERAVKAPQEPDPIHHVRLFANYLIPRKGALSPDLWRAMTIVGRNLMLTWAALLPFLAMGVVLAQAAFLWTFGHPDSLSARVSAALSLPLTFLGWFALLAGVWLLLLRGGSGGQWAITVVASGAIAAAVAIRLPGGGGPATSVIVISTLVIAAAAGTRLLAAGDAHHRRQGSAPQPRLAASERGIDRGAGHCRRWRVRGPGPGPHPVSVRQRAHDDRRGPRQVRGTADHGGQHAAHGAQQRAGRRSRCDCAEAALGHLAAADQHRSVADDDRLAPRPRLPHGLGVAVARRRSVDAGVSRRLAHRRPGHGRICALREAAPDHAAPARPGTDGGARGGFAAHAAKPCGCGRVRPGSRKPRDHHVVGLRPSSGLRSQGRRRRSDTATARRGIRAGRRRGGGAADARGQRRAGPPAPRDIRAAVHDRHPDRLDDGSQPPVAARVLQDAPRTRLPGRLQSASGGEEGAGHHRDDARRRHPAGQDLRRRGAHRSLSPDQRHAESHDRQRSGDRAARRGAVPVLAPLLRLGTHRLPPNGRSTGRER